MLSLLKGKWKHRNRKSDCDSLMKDVHLFQLASAENANEPFQTSSCEKVIVYGFDPNNALELKKILTPTKSLLLLGDLVNDKKIQNFIKSLHSGLLFIIPFPARISNSIDLFKPDYILILASEKQAPIFFRNVILHNNSKACLLLPSLQNNWKTIKRSPYKRRFLFLSSPCTGTGRFGPQLTHLTKKLGFTYHNFSPNIFNDSDQKQMVAWKELENHLIQRINYLEPNELLVFHKWFFSKNVADLKNLDIIFIMRDPRDVINSAFWFFKMMESLLTDQIPNYSSFESKKFLHQLIFEGVSYSGHRIHLNGLFKDSRFPSLEEMLDIIISAKKCPKTHLVKFEDLYQDNSGALKNLFKSLDLLSHPIASLSEADWIKAEEIGSFEFQTKGELSRGKDPSYKKSQIDIHTCRKGVVGDWKNLFDDELTKTIHQKYGDKLKAIGYEV